MLRLLESGVVPIFVYVKPCTNCRYYILTLTSIILSFTSVFGQLSGNKYIPGDYSTVALAVTALNGAGVGSGGVTFNITSNYTETITTTISLTASGTLANQIIFQKDPATSGANPILTAYTTGVGTPATAVQDGLWRLVGVQYVTINGIDLKDNPANNTVATTMEYGYALYKASTSVGCQNVTIKNCTITLNNLNNTAGVAPMVDGSTGIAVMNSLANTATTVVTPIAGGTNSNNKLYSNTIKNCNTGIALIGYAAASPFTLADTNNDVGGNSLGTGNTITNFGGAVSAANPAVGIRTLAQYGINVSYNTLNSNDGSGANHPNTLRGIYINSALSASATITYNNISVKGGGTTQALEGIENASGSTASSNTITIGNNNINNCTYTSATTGGFYGIFNSATPATINITNDTIQNNTSSAGTTGFFYGIQNSGAATSVAITSNVISGNSTAVLTTGSFIGIYNSAATPTLNINSNTLIGNSTTSITGLYYAIYNSGIVTTTININSNNIGNSTTGAFTFNAANTGAQLFIDNAAGAGTAALSISNNNFQGITYASQTAGSNTYIINSAATLSQAINSNTFTNLNINVTGAITFISNSVVLSATGTQNVNSNSISGTFNKGGASGAVTLFSSAATSAAGSITNNNNNNFSNITVNGAATIAGWVNTDAGSFTKHIQNNTFSNWTGGTGLITAMSVNLTGSNNATSGNLINNISSAGAITGILTAAGNDSIYSNTINTLSSTGISLAVTGIQVSAGASKYIFGNKIYDLSNTSSTGTVNGILVLGTTITGTINIYNNIIGDLRTPFASATDPVRGISITTTAVNSTINVYYNTIYLNATSSGANFGTTGIYHVTNATASTGLLNLRNNIIVNTSTPNGTGFTVDFRRSSTMLTNYGSTSNNNLFYAGVPGTARVIFYDGTNPDQTLTLYKARVTPTDALSVSEDLSSKFLSTTGSSVSFLHLDPTKATQAESGGVSITNFTIDYDSQIRYGNTGYSGTGSAPDMGADEIDGIKLGPLTGSVNVGSGQAYTSLTGAAGLFNAINSLGLSGNLVVSITSDLTEDGTNALYKWSETGVGNYTVSIQPNSSVLRTISGDVLAGMIRFNGVNKVTINGSNGTANKYLTFRNLNASGTTGTAFTFINGAGNITIKYCNIEAYTNATTGVMFFSTSTIVAGNSNNQVTYCSINGTVNANTSNVCIYSAGTVGKENTLNTFSNNSIYNYRDRGFDITATGSTTWTISANSFYNGDIAGAINYAAGSTLHGIRILGGAGYSILNNYIGGNANLASGTTCLYSTTLGNLSYQGILLTTTAASPISYIKGNTIADITATSTPSAAGAIAFIGIESNGSGINIGGSTTGDGNTVGSTSANGSIAVTTSTTTITFTSIVKGINCNSNGGLVIGNKVAGFDMKNIGAAPGPTSFSGIYINNAAAPSQVNSNVIGSTSVSNSIRVLSTSTATKVSVTGIALTATITSTVQVDGNTIQNVSNLSTTGTVSTGALIGISNAAVGAASIKITNNTISTLTFTTYSTGLFYGIYNSGACTTLWMNSNTIIGNTTPSASGLFYAIYNSGAVTGTININSNSIGNATSGVFTFSAANSGAQIFIYNSGGAATAALSISNNNFQGVTYSAVSTGSNTYIQNTAATLSQAINSNTFTNLSVNTSGSITFISNSVIVPATGTQNVNSNSIVTAFNKLQAGGTVTLFTSVTSSIAGSVINNNSNTFSNITVTGATTLAGWVNTDAGASSKNIQNNTFSNWTGTTGNITGISAALTGSTNNISGNAISNLTSTTGAIVGISSGAGSNNVFANIINTLSATGAAGVVTGISVTAGTLSNIYKNKIYDLQSTNASGTVNGILVSGTTIVTINIYNNIIGDLRTPAGSNPDPIRGISVTATATSSTVNLYYNTVYINGTSTSVNFGASGIYHVTSATATTVSLDMRNNSVTNTSTPKGTGITAAYRRSTTTLTNFAATSNNNLYYSGAAGATRLIYYDGTNADQTISAYKTRVASRETNSVSENLTAKYLSTTGSSYIFLHMDAAQGSLLESGGVAITNFNDDFDGQTRASSPGYSGGGTAPDIGADEIVGIEVIPPVISYTAFTNTTTNSNRNVTGITITDASGINNSAGTRPRIYYKRFSDGNVWLDNSSNTNGWKYTEATNTTSPYTFTIDYTLLYQGAGYTAGVIQYFIVAQDLATVANLAINSGTFNTAPSSVALTSTAFPITGSINSYNIPFSGTFSVGNAEVFTSLTKADGIFASINTVGLMGNTTIDITSDVTEDGTNGLNQWTESGLGNYSLTIDSDDSTMRTVSGNVVAGLIRLNGADRVKFDGTKAGTGSYLTFRNTNTSGTTGTGFTFINGATYDTIRYCTVEAYTNATNGTILFSTTTASAGNTNNLIDNCTLNATVASNTGNVIIYSAGTAGKENSSNIISNSILYNYRDRAIDITSTGSSGWSITGNNLYNGDATPSINYAASSTLHGIRILGGSGYSILNNYIGGNASLASGTNAVYSSTLGSLSYQGILLSTSSSSPASMIKGNTVASMSLTSVPSSANTVAFTGIESNGAGISIGGTGNGDGNTIGSNSANGSIIINTSTTATTNTSIVTGINCNSTGGVVTGNQVGGIDLNNTGSSPAATTFNGIYISNATPPAQINTNIIGSSGSGAINNSVRIVSTSTALATSLNGIVLGSATTAAVTLNGNSIQNINALSTTSSGSFNGILSQASSSSAIFTITNSNIKNISAAANASTSSGIYSGIVCTTPSTISNNELDNITVLASGNSAQVIGINVSGPFVYTISNNALSNFSIASTKVADVESGAAAAFNIAGILNQATVGGQVIAGDTLINFNSTTTSAINTAVSGIGITGASGGGNIYNNRLASFTNTATGSSTLPGINGIAASAGTFNVYNNSIKLDNGSNTNGIKIYGINHATSTNWNYYYNTIITSGSATGSAARSASFIRTVSGTLTLRNNILINTRTGTGSNFALSNIVSPPATNWPSSTADYNDIYSSVSANTAEWGNAVNLSFSQWQTVSGGGTHSINKAITVFSSAYDTQPDSTTNCTLNNGGLVITSPAITTDINNNTRSVTAPDMGAYEFNYVLVTISATNSSPTCSGSAVAFFGNSGTALSPAYSWKDPSNTVISTAQNPSVPAVAGIYTLLVTDILGCSVSTTTTVSVNTRPTGSLSGTTAICPGNSATISITVTGSGTINGTLSNGDNFSGTAPLITISESPAGTTTYKISSLTDANCTSISSDIPDSVVITVKSDPEWTGAINTDWNNTGNWFCSVIPDGTTNAIVPGGLTNYPVLTLGTNAVGNLVIKSGGVLTISGATFQIGGSISNSGTFNTGSGTIEMNGTTAQTIPAGAFSSNTLAKLIISNNVTLAGADTLTGNLEFGNVNNKTFTTGGFLTFASTATASARVADITNNGVNSGNAISGNVTVQRYIPGRRKYRLITSSVTTSASATLISGQEGLSIWGNWQNQGNTSVANTGTIITGGVASDGFDIQSSRLSLFTYSDSTNKYVGLGTSTGKNTKYTPLKAGLAYYMFIYGDRTNSVLATIPNNTKLTATGTLLTGTQTYTNSSAMPLSNVVGRFTLLGNPFQSAIDWASVGKTNLTNTYWGWDPNLSSTGGYITVSTTGTITLISPVSGSIGLNQYIQPGQGFFVRTTATSPVLTIREQDKVSTFNNLAFTPTGNNGPNNLPFIAINLLYDNSVSKLLLDGTLSAFDSSYSNAIGAEDAFKMTGNTEGIAISHNASLLSIDARKLPVDNDTIFLNVSKFTKPQYILQIFANQLQNANILPYLEDTYLHTSQLLSVTDTNYITFTVSPSDSGSFDMNRFRIVFHQTSTLPVTLTSISATKLSTSTRVDWSVASESNVVKYYIDRSADGIAFSKIGEVSSRNLILGGSYQFYDAHPVEGINYYRISAVLLNGHVIESEIATVNFSTASSANIMVYPNPIINQQINLQLSGMEKGTYPVMLYNPLGILVNRSEIEYQGGLKNYLINPKGKLPRGLYILKVKGFADRIVIN